MNNFARKILPFSIVLILMVIFALTTDYFFTWTNINGLFRDTAFLGIVSIGVTFVMLGGELDLSVGSIMGLVMMIEARLLNDAHITSSVVVILGLLVGLLCGLLNGFIVNKLRIGGFMATLASQMLLRGCVYLFTFKDSMGNIVTKTLNNAVFMKLGSTIGGIYYSVFIWIALVIISYIVLKKTKFGVYTYACGTSVTSSLLSGINVTKMRYAFYLISSVSAAIAATFILAWQGATTLTGGTGYEFNAIVVVVVGGAALAGGTGDTIGTAAGSIFMILIVNGLYKYGIPSEYQYIVQGVIIIAVASFSAIKSYIATANLRKKAYKSDMTQMEVKQ